MKILVIGSGASWSTADVENGLIYGLKAQGAEVIHYALAGRINGAGRWLHNAWRIKAKTAKKTGAPEPVKPTTADVFYQASMGALERALRHQVDAVVAVSGMYLHPDVLILMRRAGLLVTVLFTESPYDTEAELRVAELVHGVWTNERTVVDKFYSVCPHVRYLPHAWHPEHHSPGLRPGDEELPQHDVVFVGTAFKERVEWFRSIDWTGIDLGLYGQWDLLGSRDRLRQYVRGGCQDNHVSAGLYRRAKIGLNLYRTSKGWGRHAPQLATGAAESLSPRAYELAACGVFHLSDARAEVAEMFGALVPTFRSATEAAALIRAWLVDDAGRAQVSAQLPATVAESSWLQRAAQVHSDLQALIDWRQSQAA